METKNATTEKQGAVWEHYAAAFAKAILPSAEAEEDTNTAITTPQPMLEAMSLVCVLDRWMHSSVKGQFEAGLALITKQMVVMEGKNEATSQPSIDCASEFLPALVKDVDRHTPTLISALLRKGFFHPEKKDETFDEDQVKLDGYQQYNQTLPKIFSLPRRDKAVTACALYVIYALCSIDEVSAALTRIVEHLTVCQPGQQQGADYLYEVVGVKLQAHAGAGAVAAKIATREEKVLRSKFEGYFQDYLDDHKERALLSGVIEPAKYVLTCSGQGIRHMEINGRSWYLVAMQEALTPSTAGGGDETKPGRRVAFPIPVNEDDPNQIGVIHPYGNLTFKGMRVFQDRAHFGKGWEGIQDLKEKAGFKPKNRVTRQENRVHSWKSYQHPTHVRAAFEAERKQKKASDYTASEDLAHWAVMAEHLAFFFCQDFFVPKCFETLNGETKPEYVGFRQCCVELFQFYKKAPEFVKPQRPQAGPEELDQDDEFYAHCYEDEYYTKLDLESVTRFFSWLGAVKAKGTYISKPVEKDEMALEQEEGRHDVMGEADAEWQRVKYEEDSEWSQLMALDRAATLEFRSALQRRKNQEYTQSQQKRAALKRQLRGQVTALKARRVAVVEAGKAAEEMGLCEPAAEARVQLVQMQVEDDVDEFDLFAAEPVEQHLSTNPVPVAGGGGAMDLEEIAVMEKCDSSESMGVPTSSKMGHDFWQENHRSTSFEG